MIFLTLGSLHFQTSPWTLVLAGLVMITAFFLCLTACRRAVRKWRTGSLEVLRYTLILIGCLLLLGPEWRTIESADVRPEVAILWDDTGSMDTEDARLPKSQLGAENSPKVTTRADLTQRLLATKFYRNFEENGANRVTIRSFGTPPEEGADLATRTMAGTDLNAALKETIRSSRNLRALVLFSDGDRNLGKPPVEAAQQLRLRGAPLYVVPTGSDSRLPDLELESVNAPTYGIVGENVQIPFTIESSLARDVRTMVKIRSSSGTERTKDITIPANGTFYDSILWKLEKEGLSTLTLSIPVARGELVAKNNARDFVMNGKPEDIKVLVIETLPRWEYRYIRNALSRDPGVDVDCLLLHPELGPGDGPDYIQEFPEKPEDLQKYDVVFLGDIGIGPKQLTLAQTEMLKGLVESQASGIVFLPGPLGNQRTLQGTPLGGLVPVELDKNKPVGLSDIAASPMRLTSEGEKSLLTMLGDNEQENEAIWQSLPGFYWQAAVIKAKAGSKVLAVNDNRRNASGRLPILVTSRAGSGKILYLAIDSAWRWRRGVEDKYHYRFWGQVARWMSYQRNMAAGERIRLFFSPERPKPGDSVFLSANAFSESGVPLQEGKVLTNITEPGGKVRQLTLRQDEGSWGSFSGKFEITQPGTWTLETSIEGSPETTIEARIISQADQIEKTGLPIRRDILEEITSVARGAIISPENLSGLVAQIQSLPEPQPLVTSIKLWAHWLTPTIFLTLLALFWTLRKFNGTF